MATRKAVPARLRPGIRSAGHVPPIAAVLRGACDRLQRAALAPALALDFPKSDRVVRERARRLATWASNLQLAHGFPKEMTVPAGAPPSVLDIVRDSPKLLGVELYRGIDLIGRLPDYLDVIPPGPHWFVVERQPKGALHNPIDALNDPRFAGQWLPTAAIERDKQIAAVDDPASDIVIAAQARLRALVARAFSGAGGRVVPPDTLDGTDLPLLAAHWTEIELRWRSRFLVARAQALRLVSWIESRFAEFDSALRPTFVIYRLANGCVRVANRSVADPDSEPVMLPPTQGAQLLIDLAEKHEARSYRKASLRLERDLPELCGLIERPPTDEKLPPNFCLSRVAPSVARRWVIVDE